MLERGELSQITANAELADRLLATARQHLASARLLADTDSYLAYVPVYGANGLEFPQDVVDRLPAQAQTGRELGGALAVEQQVPENRPVDGPEVVKAGGRSPCRLARALGVPCCAG